MVHRRTEPDSAIESRPFRRRGAGRSGRGVECLPEAITLVAIYCSRGFTADGCRRAEDTGNRCRSSARSTRGTECRGHGTSQGHSRITCVANAQVRVVMLHVIQHVEFEGPGRIAAWALDRKCRLTTTRLYQDEPLPEAPDADGLVILGG